MPLNLFRFQTNLAYFLSKGEENVLNFVYVSRIYMPFSENKYWGKYLGMNYIVQEMESPGFEFYSGGKFKELLSGWRKNSLENNFPDEMTWNDLSRG